MKVVVKLGGVNGSGKTSVANALIKATNPEVLPYRLVSGKTTELRRGLHNGVPVYILGKYATACGGMDTISDKEDRYQMIADIATKRGDAIIFFEGLITGKTYGALGALSEKHVKARRARWLYAFMDTPFDVAADRVRQRRLAAGNSAPFDPERTMRSTYDACVRLESYLRGEAVGKVPVKVQPVISLPHKQKPIFIARKLMSRARELYDEGF
jgi:hypothetical protein